MKRGVFMCTNNNNSPCSCIREILKIILILQENAEPNERRLDTCDKRVLGNDEECRMFNTRPITLYTDDSNGRIPWSMPISKDPFEDRESHIFRVEKIDDCCCTFRVLVPVRCERHEDGCEEDRDDIKLRATNSFFTMNINCICCVKCLEDTFVDCV
jgi:hypothetical protein